MGTGVHPNIQTGLAHILIPVLCIFAGTIFTLRFSEAQHQTLNRDRTQVTRIPGQGDNDLGYRVQSFEYIHLQLLQE